MFKTLRNAFKIKDIRAKLLFTLIALLIVRLGCLIPVPGVDRDYFQLWLDSTMGDNLGFLDALTGGSFTGNDRADERTGSAGYEPFLSDEGLELINFIIGNTLHLDGEACRIGNDAVAEFFCGIRDTALLSRRHLSINGDNAGREIIGSFVAQKTHCFYAFLILCADGQCCHVVSSLLFVFVDFCKSQAALEHHCVGIAIIFEPVLRQVGTFPLGTDQKQLIVFANPVYRA